MKPFFVHAVSKPANKKSEGDKTVKPKTWKVTTNTGKQADLECGLEKKEVQKPTHISPKEFVHWLAAKSRIDDECSIFILMNPS